MYTVVMCQLSSGSGSGIISSWTEIFVNGLKAQSCGAQCVHIRFVLRGVGWWGAHMSNHVCREVLFLIQQPGNVASFHHLPMRLIVSGRSLHILSALVFLPAVYSSLSLPLFSVLLVFFLPSAFWGECYSAATEKSSSSSKNKVKCLD